MDWPSAFVTVTALITVWLVLKEVLKPREKEVPGEDIWNVLVPGTKREAQMTAREEIRKHEARYHND